MELFTLLGKIAINTDNSINMLDTVAEKAHSVADRIERFGEGMQSFGNKIANAGTKLTLGLTAPLVGIGTVAVKTTADFESAMSEVGAISGATGEEFTVLEELAKKMGETTKFSASEAAAALKYMAMAGWKTDDMLSGLQGVLNLAAASGEELATTSDIVTDALTAMGYSAGDAGHLADVMAAASSNANTNVSLMGETFKYAGTMAGTMRYRMEDVALAIGLMANSGVKGSMAGTSLNAIISRLATNTNGATECINELGIEFYNADGTARNFRDVIEELRVATNGLSTEQKAEIASTIAGEEAKKGLLAILNATAEDYNKLSGAIDNCNGSAQSMADTMNDNLKGQLTLLKSQLEALAIQFITLIMPYLRQGVEWLTKLCTWISGLDDNTKKMILTVAGIAAVAGPVLTIGGKIIAGAGKIVSGVSGIISIAGKLSPVVGAVISGGGKVIIGIGSLVGKIGSVLIPAIAAIPGPVWIVIGVLTALVAAGVAVYKNWDDIKAWASEKWAAIQEIVGNAASKIGEFFQGLSEKIHELKDNIAQKATEIRNTVSEKFAEMKEQAVEKVGELKDKIVYKVEEIKTGAVERFNSLKESVVSKVEEMKENAASKIAEMRDKVSAGFQEMKEKAAEKFSDLKEKWTSKFKETREKMISEAVEMKEKVGEKLSELKENAVEKIETLRSNVSQKFNELKSDATAKLSEVAQKGVEGFNAIREKGSAAINSLKTFTHEKFTEMGNVIFSKFDGVGEKIQSLFSGVHDKVKNTVDKIKEFFQFDWKLPDIKLPHFSIDWDKSGMLGSLASKIGLPGLPKLDVEWYAKGGIMTEPTAFGINPYSGNVMVGGEAGAEAIAPIETLKAYVGEAVDLSNFQMYEVMTAILNLLREYLPEMNQRQLVMDTGALVGELGTPMYEEFARIKNNRGRRN